VKRALIPLVVVVLMLFLAMPVDAFAGPAGGPPAGSDFSPTEIVVGFKPGVTPPGMAVVHSQAGGRAKHDIPALGAQVVTIPAGTVGQSIRRYEAHPLVAYAEPNYIASVLAEPNDTYFPSQWGLHNVEAPAAWDITTGSPEVVIAILDTGVAPEHPDLGDKLVGNVNFTDSPTADDVHGHGTHVAGIAAAVTNNGMGVAGLGYDSSIMNVKVLGDTGSGYYSWIAAGITWAADNGAHVINMSLGGTSSSQLLEDAVDYAWDKGSVVVAAAGNSGTSSPIYPAYYANCIAVAATDRDDNLASWSSFGDWVDVAAPGELIFSTLKGDDYGRKSGTSMAAPHVAGLAALVFTAVSDENGNGRVNDEVQARIESTCDDIGEEGIGAGRINAARAVGAYDSEPEPEPGVQIAVSAEPSSVSEAGTEITYTYAVSNTGEVDLTGVAVHDDLLGVITLNDEELAPGDSTEGTATYTVTQDDIDAGDYIVNTATVTNDQGVTDSDSATVTVAQDAAVELTLFAHPTSVTEAGEVITYTYTVTNEGNVTLTGIVVDDDRLGIINLDDDELAPGDSTGGTATYTVTQADIDASDDIVSTATVTADEGVTDTDSTTVGVVQQPDVGILVTADPTTVSEAGSEVTYTYSVTNEGNTRLTGIVVDDDKLGDITLNDEELAPGDHTTGTAIYTVTQDDIDAGADIVNTATVATDQDVTDSDSAKVTIEQQSDVQITVAADPTSVSEAGDVITYTYTVTNTGLVTLTGIAVTDDQLSDITLNDEELAPGDSTEGAATYTVSQDDIDAGDDIVGKATVTCDQDVTDHDSASVTIVQQPDVAIALAADPTSVSEAGSVITYTYTVTNEGNATLTGIEVYDHHLDASITLNDDELAPGESTSGEATYTVTQDDIDAGDDIVSTATATTDQGVTDHDSATVSIVQQPDVDIALTAEPASVSEADTEITYSYTVTNTGLVTLTGIAVTDDLLGRIPLANELAPGDSTEGTATYAVTQADIDAGTPIVNTATATSDQGVTDSDSATVTVAQDAAVELTLFAHPTSVTEAGEVITYTYTVTNTGKTTLTGIVVTDDLLGDIALDDTELAPGDSTGGTGTYTVTQTDIDCGADITTTATVTNDQGVTDSHSAMVTVVQHPDVDIAVAADPTSVSEAGGVITYTYTVSNTGKVTLTDLTVTDSRLGSIPLGTNNLAPGSTTTGTASYTVSQDDIDSGAVIISAASVSTDQGVNDSKSTTVTITQQSAVQITVTANPTSVSEAGTTVSYTYTVTNEGNTTLTGITVEGDKLGDINLNDEELAPGDSTEGTATYTVSLDDIDSGADIVNTATVSTDQGVTDEDSATVTIDKKEIAMVTLSPADSSGRGWAGESVIYELTVENAGNIQDNYDIFTTSGWISSVVPQSLALEPGESATITVTHTVTEDVVPGDCDTGTVNVISTQTDADASATFTTAARVSAVEITPPAQSTAASPGEPVEYTYTISNIGTDDEVYDLAVSATWEASPDRTSILVQAGTETEVIVTHIVPNGAADDTSDSGTLTVASGRATAIATFITTAEEEEPTAPVINLFEVTDRSNPVWAWVNVDWAVSGELGNLATVEIVMVLNDEIVDSVVLTVEGYEADGRDHLRARNGHGYDYEIILTVTDADGNTSSMTEKILLGAAKNGARGSTTAR